MIVWILINRMFLITFSSAAEAYRGPGDPTSDAEIRRLVRWQYARLHGESKSLNNLILIQIKSLDIESSVIRLY